MAYVSEDKIASIVERVVTRLQAGEERVPLNPNPRPRPAEVNPPYGCGPRSERPTRTGPAPYSGATRGSLGKGVFADIERIFGRHWGGVAMPQGFHAHGPGVE